MHSTRVVNTNTSPKLANMYTFFPIIIIVIIIIVPVALSTFPGHYVISGTNRRQNLTGTTVTESQEYFELAQSLPSDHLTPSCSLPVLIHSFGNTMGSPPVSVAYSPPPVCPPPWSRVVLDFSASCRGEQYDRIAGLWLDGVEILRTSTAEPTESGIFWNVRKDITKYSSLIAKSNLTLTMMLENLVNEVFTGVYHVNVTFLFYDATHVKDPPLNSVYGHRDRYSSMLNRKLGFEKHTRGVNIDVMLGAQSVYGRAPADLIIPISEDKGRDQGFWFRIENEKEIHMRNVQIPANTVRVVMELYVSFHGNDEFWYSNPPDSYIKANNLTTGRGNGAYREVYLTIDGEYIASVVPFPVIFTGGINPLFWGPVVAIGAFNLPSYDVNLTPFLEILLNNVSNSFAIGVADGISFWLVDANLHIWVDDQSKEVQAQSIIYTTPTDFVKKVESDFKQLDGSFKVTAERRTQSVGLVKSNEGDLTTRVLEQFKLKNTITFQSNGTYKYVKQRISAKTEVRLENDMGVLLDRVIMKRSYPLNIITSNQEEGNGTYLVTTNVSHSFTEKVSGLNYSRRVHNSQESVGWMLVEDHSVLDGEAGTNETLSYTDDSNCYSRTVTTINGLLVSDNSTLYCADSS